MSRPKSLSALASPIARSALGKRYAALGALLEDWPHIVGPALAERALPEKLDFPRGRRDVVVDGVGNDDIGVINPLIRLNAHGLSFFDQNAADRLTQLDRGPVSFRSP